MPVPHQPARPLPRPASSRRGFSLIELLVVLVIAGILLAVGLPNMQSYFVGTRLASTTNDLQTALNLARSEAIKRGSRVVMARTGSTSRDWGAGWQMFVDLDNDDTLDSGELTLRTANALPGAVSVYASTGAADRVVFDPQGRLLGGAAVFMICYDGSNIVVNGERRAAALLVAGSGRVRAATYDTGNRPLNDADPQVAITSCTNPA